MCVHSSYEWALETKNEQDRHIRGGAPSVRRAECYVLFHHLVSLSLITTSGRSVLLPFPLSEWGKLRLREVVPCLRATPQ